MISDAEVLAFQAAFDVSRETVQRLESYLALLERWNPRINLVSASSLRDGWRRHVVDSAQLWPLRPTGTATWLDLGAGAGFPGLVIAVLAAEASPGLSVALVESDGRKAAFLATVVRALGLDVRIDDTRIESLPAQAADVVSARALAPLGSLLAMTQKHRRTGGIGLFPKGETVHKEIADASRSWRFEHKIYPSLTEAKAAILEIGAIARA